MINNEHIPTNSNLDEIKEYLGEVDFHDDEGIENYNTFITLYEKDLFAAGIEISDNVPAHINHIPIEKAYELTQKAKSYMREGVL